MKKLFLSFVIFSAFFAACENPLMTEILEYKTVSFNSNGGSSVPSQNLIKNRKVNKPGDPVKTDFVFAAWYIDNGSFVYEWDFDAAPTGSMTLHAKWKSVSQVASIEIKSQPEKLTFVHTDSLDLNGLVVTLVYDDDTEVDAALDEFESKGITTVPAHGDVLSRSTHNGQPVTVSYGDVTAWTENLTVEPKVIDFNVDPIQAQLYTGNPITPAVTVKDGETPLAPESDYTVVYSDNTNAGIAIVTITGIGSYEGSTGSATFTISDKIFTVAFNADGGTPAPPQQDIGSGFTVAEPAAMAKTGYTFIGWFKDEGFVTPWDFANDTVSDDITLYAKWDINKYTVTFNADDGTPAPGQQNIDYGGTVTQPAAMTKTGYTFGGWYKEADCINTWNFSTDTVTAAVTLYAKWVENTAGITISVEQITEGVTISAGNIVISRTGSNKTYTLTVSNPSDYSSIRWEISGVGNYAGQKIEGTDASFELDASDAKYNSLGIHTLRLYVTKDAVPYMVNIEFEIVG